MNTKNKTLLIGSMLFVLLFIIAGVAYLILSHEPNLKDTSRLIEPGRPLFNLYSKNDTSGVTCPNGDDRYLTLGLPNPESEESVKTPTIFLNSPNTERRVPIDCDPSIQRLIGVRPDFRLISASTVSQISTHNGDGPKSIKLFDQGIYPSNSPLQSHAVTFDGHYTIDALELSPDGEHIAWLVSGRYRSPIEEILTSISPAFSKFFPNIKEEGPAIWVSRTDGSDRHSLGFMRKGKTPIGKLYWTADGRDISFDYDERRWVTPFK